MIIKLFSRMGFTSPVVNKTGDILTIDGVVYDFTLLGEGEVLPYGSVNNDFIVGDVTRVNGDLVIPLLFSYGEEASDLAKFPEPIVNPPDGLLEFPL